MERGRPPGGSVGRGGSKGEAEPPPWALSAALSSPPPGVHPHSAGAASPPKTDPSPWMGTSPNTCARPNTRVSEDSGSPGHPRAVEDGRVPVYARVSGDTGVFRHPCVTGRTGFPGDLRIPVYPRVSGHRCVPVRPCVPEDACALVYPGVTGDRCVPVRPCVPEDRGIPAYPRISVLREIPPALDPASGVPLGTLGPPPSPRKLTVAPIPWSAVVSAGVFTPSVGSRLPVARPFRRLHRRCIRAVRPGPVRSGFRAAQPRSAAWDAQGRGRTAGWGGPRGNPRVPTIGGFRGIHR